MLKKLKFYKSILIITIVFVSHSACAKTKSLGSHNSWKAYSSVIDKIRTCFIASEPEISKGKYKKNNRGKTYIFVTIIKGSTQHEVSVVAGYKFKKDSDVFFSIDKQKTKMFAVDDRAWTESTKTDKLIVKAMKRGKKLVVTGTSSPGNLIKDTYSLIGFTKALSIIDKTCS